MSPYLQTTFEDIDAERNLVVCGKKRNGQGSYLGTSYQKPVDLSEIISDFVKMQTKAPTFVNSSPSSDK